MTQQYEVRGRATSVFTDTDGYTNVIYHNTAVVQFNADRIILDTGGFYSYTTKTRMMQASRQFDLGYVVYQRDHTWYVQVGDNDPVEWDYYTDYVIIHRRTDTVEVSTPHWLKRAMGNG